MQNEQGSNHVTVYRPKDAARKLEIGKSKIYEMIASGELPSIRLGKRCIRIPANALHVWIEKRTAQNAALGERE